MANGLVVVVVDVVSVFVFLLLRRLLRSSRLCVSRVGASLQWLLMQRQVVDIVCRFFLFSFLLLSSRN